jgi:hypothetical protein
MTDRWVGVVVLGVVTGALLLAGAAGAQDGCKPVMLCPYDGAAGVAGGGGTGGGGGTAGQPPAPGKLEVSELGLSRRVVRPDQTLEAEVTLTNAGGAPLALREVRIAARAPGASHEGGPFTDLAPALTQVTIPAGGQVTLAAARRFTPTDTLGWWEAYATYQDAEGWHDAPSKYFAMVRAGGGAGGSGGGTPAAGAMTVGAQSWFVAPWAGTDYFRSGVPWATAYAAGDDIWNPQFLAELEGFAVWRHMDMNAVNWSKIERWAQRRLPTDPGNQEIYIDGSSSPDTTGLAVEWQIDLCNRARIHCWFTHPYLADDDYLRQQAQLIKAKLNPSLTVYVELSNEVWNGSFSAFNQAIQAGQAMGVPGDNQYYQGIAHEMVRALQMYQIYEEVFGVGAMGTRVVRVFSQSGNLDLTTQALRDVYDSPQWNPSSQTIDLMALAPYIGSGVSGADETLARWRSEVDDKVEGEPITTALELHVRAYDIPMLGCYEAGMHQLTSADQWASNSEAYDGYVYMLDRFAEKMNGPCALYTLHGTWEPKGAWGLYDHVGQTASAAPKAQATKAWIAGTAVRDTGTARLIALVVFVLLVVAFIVLALHYLQRSRSRPPPDGAPPPED